MAYTLPRVSMKGLPWPSNGQFGVVVDPPPLETVRLEDGVADEMDTQAVVVTMVGVRPQS
jgi:hypothetical protein